MGVYTDHTDTDDQVLKPHVRRRLEHRLEHLPPAANTYTVRRLVLTEKDAPADLEPCRFIVHATNAAAASRAADAAKHALEVKRGHHQRKCKGRRRAA